MMLTFNCVTPFSIKAGRIIRDMRSTWLDSREDEVQALVLFCFVVVVSSEPLGSAELLGGICFDSPGLGEEWAPGAPVIESCFSVIGTIRLM